MMIGFGILSRVVFYLLGLAIPAFQCHMALREKEGEIWPSSRVQPWLQYWTMAGIYFGIFDPILNLFLNWVPFYWEIKISILWFGFFPIGNETFKQVYTAFSEELLGPYRQKIARQLRIWIPNRILELDVDIAVSEGLAREREDNLRALLSDSMGKNKEMARLLVTQSRKRVQQHSRKSIA